MVNVGIILFHNMRYAPFFKFYESLLSQNENIHFDVIYYNRYEELHEVEDANHIAIKWIGKGTNSAGKLEKALNFAAYPIFVKRILNQKKYDFIICLMTMPGVLLSGYLQKHYNGRYLIDVRDYTQEHVKKFYEAETRLMEHAAVRVISSPGFRNFLPQAQYLLCHNLDSRAEELHKLQPPYHKAENRPIVISYIGGISYEKQCLQLIDLVQRDNRFEFHFYGNESTSHTVSDRVKEVNCDRIRMFGPFLPEQKPEIYANSDLVFNCYGNDRTLVKYAISNKHYDGALYRRPLVMSPDTTMCDLAGKFGYALDLDSLADLEGLYRWYIDLDEKAYTEFADGIVEQAAEDNRRTAAAIMSAILDVKKYAAV